MQTLSTVDLTKSFKGRKVVDGVTLRIAQGEVVGLLGPNGAGKTTTFYIIVGLATADAGKVLLDGFDISGLPMYIRARNGISYLPQEPSVFRKLTVEENLMAILETIPLTENQRRERLEELLEQFGLQKVRRSYGYLLSGGERRRVEVARSLVISPSFVLLDEPFAGIDPLAIVDIQNIILQLRASGIGVLLTDHNVRETLQVTDRAYIISGGKVFRSGTPEELGSDTEVKRVYFGDHFKLAI
jgi:lipopolysaccharide export system ATP-binding protein